MNWYDWMALAIMAVVTVVQTMRGIRAGGFGLPLFEAAGVVVSAALAISFTERVAETIHVRQSTVMLALFVVSSILAFLVARYLFAMTLLTFQSLDGVLSCICGLAMAWAIAHMFLRVMLVSEGGVPADAIASSPVAREILQFRTWNTLMRLLFKAKTGQDVDPDLG